MAELKHQLASQKAKVDELEKREKAMEALCGEQQEHLARENDNVRNEILKLSAELKALENHRKQLTTG